MEKERHGSGVGGGGQERVSSVTCYLIPTWSYNKNAADGNNGDCSQEGREKAC